MTSRRAAGAVLLVSALGATACAETTVDSGSSVGTAVASNTVSTVPATAAGTPAALGAQLVADSRALSAFVVDGEGEDEALARLDATWRALRPVVEERRDDLLDDFDAAIALARTAVERRRPADADKASNNLATLVAAADLT